MLGFKLALLTVTVIATWLLSPWTTDADFIAAAGMAVLVATVGPILHPHFIRRSAPAQHCGER